MFKTFNICSKSVQSSPKITLDWNGPVSCSYAAVAVADAVEFKVADDAVVVVADADAVADEADAVASDAVVVAAVAAAVISTSASPDTTLQTTLAVTSV